MSEAEARPTNFIRQIIDEDLASGKHTTVHTRFPPEPNGYLHIGHAKSICLNFGIAQDYKGQCNLRFDDTNPVKEDIEYVDSIKNDVEWLGFHWSGNVRYSSDYFDQLHAYAIELINKGLAYVDELTPEQIREYRGTLTQPGKNSPYRDRSVEENLALFEKMRTGGFEEGKACLRAKIDMASPFIVMRDPVLYRIKFADHHQTGSKWCIYPMYDFTHCISDALEGITHSLCTLEFQDNRRLYDWVLEQEASGCDRYLLSVDQLLYGGLVASRLAKTTTERDGVPWPLTDLLECLLSALAEDPNNEVWLLDSVMRLAPTVGYAGGTLEYYNAMRTIGAAPRKTLTGDELTLENIRATYDTDADGHDLLCFEDNVMHDAALRYTEHRINKLTLSGELLETVSRIGGDRFHVLIGIDDSSSEDCIQKNEIAYLQARLRAGDVILSGVDDLAFKAVTKLYLSEIGWNGAQINVQYFGGTEDRPACDYDYKPLTEIVAEHLGYFCLTAEDTPAFADLYVLVLTQPEDAAQKQQYIQELTAVLNERLKANLPVILIDASNGQYGTVFHDALTKKAELGKLLSYAGFLDMAIVTGTALSHGVARYAHLVQGRTSQAEEVAFCKTLADSILKDFCYKNVVREDILSYVRNDLGGDANNFCLPELDRPAIVARLTAGMDKATAPVLKNLERSSLLIGLKPHVDTVTAHWGKVCLSNYRFPWNRAFEIDMDISVDPLTR